MADLPLFYRSITPLNRDQHRDLRLGSPAQPFAFARTTHLIPALIEEFGAAARHVPIVFLPGGQQPTPLFLVGLRPGANSFVDEQGRWTGGYIPAFVRRYPFIYGDVEGHPQPIVCIDTGFDGFSQEAGESLFGPDGAETPRLLERVKFVNDYYVSAKQTDVFSARLREFDLLRPITIETKAPGGENAVIHGLFAIDEPKFMALPDETFLALRAAGFLPAIYAHFISLGAVDRLRADGSSKV